MKQFVKTSIAIIFGILLCGTVGFIYYFFFREYSCPVINTLTQEELYIEPENENRFVRNSMVDDEFIVVHLDPDGIGKIVNIDGVKYTSSFKIEDIGNLIEMNGDDIYCLRIMINNNDSTPYWDICFPEDERLRYENERYLKYLIAKHLEETI